MGHPAGGLSAIRRQLVGSLYLRGFTERQIAAEVRKKASEPDSPLAGAVKTTHITVHKDIVACRAEWAKRYAGKLEKKREAAVARLEEVQHQAWIDHSEANGIGASQAKAAALRLVVDVEATRAKIEGTVAPLTITGDESHPLEVAISAKSKVLGALDRLASAAGEETDRSESDGP